MRLTYEKYEEIKNVVTDTLELCNINSIPIYGFPLAQALNITCIPYSSLSDEKQQACLKLSEDGFTLDNIIYYNDSMPQTRIRFTIMHELGHIILGHTESTETTESEANFFACYILVPPVLIYAHDRTSDIDKDLIRTLFKVSDEVAGYSLNGYKKWLNTYPFHFSGVDNKIYNLFFRPSNAI